MRRFLLAFCALACLTADAVRADEDTISHDGYNFAITRPSDDWDIKEIDKETLPAMQAWFYTEFTALDPVAVAELKLYVFGLSRRNAKKSLEKLVEEWKSIYEASVVNPRNRTTKEIQIAGQPAIRVDVEGDFEEGEQKRSWVLFRYGQFFYLIVVDRTFKATRDEDLEEEVQEMLDSFKFLKEFKSLTPAKKGGPGDPPDPGAAGGKAKKEKIDPKLLEKEKKTLGFWRIKFTKPYGFVWDKLDPKKNPGVKAQFRARGAGGAFAMVTIYSDTSKTVTRTIKQLSEHYTKAFNERYPQHKDPVVNKKYKFPNAKRALRVELVGRKGAVVKEIWLMADCKNDRQYRIRIYTASNGHNVFKRQIAEFEKSVTTLKK